MKDPLLGNKIAAAVLTALLLVFGLPQLTGAIFGGGHHGGGAGELNLAYCCVELDFGGAAEAAEEAPYDLGALLANASVAGGERRAALCRSCHTCEEGGATGTGPTLWNKMGAPVASRAGFNYTAALEGIGGVWTYERMDEYLRNSQAYVPGGGMVQRIPRDEHRADILAYLGSLSANPLPFPEPLPAPEPAAEEAAAGEGE